MTTTLCGGRSNRTFIMTIQLKKKVTIKRKQKLFTAEDFEKPAQRKGHRPKGYFDLTKD